MCCGGSEPEVITQQASVPSWLQDFYKQNTEALKSQYATAKNIYNANANYTPYSGQRVADLTANQQAAAAQAAANDGSNGANNLADAATAVNYIQGRGYGYSDNFDPSQVQTNDWSGSAADKYMNPYQDQVIDTTVSEMERSNDRRRLQDQGRAAQAGAFGSTRHGILDAEREREFDQVLGDTVGGLQQQGYQNAQQQFNADRSQSFQTQNANNLMGLQAFNANRDQWNRDLSNGLNTAKLQAGIGTARNALHTQNLNNLMTTGAMQQGNQQQKLDTGYQDFLNQRNWPYQNYAFLQGALRGTNYNPYQGMQNQVTTQPGQSGWGQAAGLATTGVGILGATGAFGSGGWLTDMF